MSETNKLILSIESKDLPVSKSMKEFNQLLKRLDLIEEQLHKTKKVLDEKLTECHALIQPLYTSGCEVKLELVKSIICFMSENKVSKRNERVLKNYCSYTLQNIAMSPHNLAENKYKELQILMKENLQVNLPNFNADDHASSEDETNSEERKSDEKERAQEIEEMKEGVRQRFAQYGIELNLDHITAAMSDAEIDAEILRAVQETMESKGRATKSEKKMTKAQQKKAEAKRVFEEMKSKTFTSIYKDLVKLIHPDGEIDQERKMLKTEWMKRLTVAYKRKDLKTLLIIELEWLNTSKDKIQRMTEEKVIYFNSMLKEQISEKQTEKSHLLNNSRYFLLAYFAGGPMVMQNLNLKRVSVELIKQKEFDESSIKMINYSASTGKTALNSIVDDLLKNDVYGDY